MPFGYDPANRTETAISDREFTDCIRPLNARKLVVLLDCCHAGGVPALKEVGEAFVRSPIPPNLLNILDTGSGRIVIASSREGESSYTGNPYSVFTACLLEALKGKGTIYPDGYSRILDVLAYLFRTVPGRTQDQQHPYVRRVLDLGDNFPLCYYAASSKQVPEGASLETHLPTIFTFTTYSRSHILQKLNALRAEWDLRMEKLRRIRSRIAIETDIAVSFKLEHQALDEEAAMAALEAQMRELERAAQDA